jgi:arylsulfatase A-like enzyme
MRKLYFTALLLFLISSYIYIGSQTIELNTSDTGQINASQIIFFNNQSVIDADYECPDCNVILISIDTLRADHLGAYGYERNTSPYLDKFARENILFKNHISTVGTTLPSHASMFTGLYLKNHGIFRNRLVLNDSLITLAEILDEEGYETAGIVSAAILADSTKISQGFDEYLDDINHSTNATFTTERAISWLDKNKEAKFFLFLHYWDPHAPPSSPVEYHLWGGNVSSYYDADLYDADIKYLDDNLKNLFDFLNEKGLVDNTVIILTADHGESLGEKRFWGHGRPLHAAVTHIPLIIHLPGLGSNMEIEHQTSSVDLLPTVLDILKIRRYPDYDGISLLGDDKEKRKYVFIQRRSYEGQDNPVDRPTEDNESFEFGNKYAIRSNEWKYVYRTQYEDELYHLPVDPYEEYNLINKSYWNSIAPELKKILVDWLNVNTDVHISDKEVDEEAKERLKALGYMI